MKLKTKIGKISSLIPRRKKVKTLEEFIDDSPAFQEFIEELKKLNVSKKDKELAEIIEELEYLYKKRNRQ